MRTVRLSADAIPLQHQVQVKDRVRLQTTAHVTMHLTVTAIEPDAIVGLQDGQERRIPLHQVAQLEVEQVDGVKTAGLVTLALGVLAVIVGKSIYKDGLRLAPK